MALFEVVVVCICLICRCGVQATSKQSGHGILNKPDLISALPSTEDVDFDCVDIDKQPALSHPLLKNHKIQLYPKFSKKQNKNIKSLSHTTSISAEVVNEGCPPGKIPIHRSKLDHQFEHLFSQDFPGQHFATIETSKADTFHGGQANISVNKPTVTSDQYSMGQIWVQNGPLAELNSIQAGWAVNPQLYGDYEVHMTAGWTADGFRKTGCFNAACPGFVQVNSRLFLGQRFANMSVPGGLQFILQLSIVQEQSTGKWWLMNQDGEQIGYWPRELFNHLQNGASVVRYGGTTKASATGASPQMGNGNFPQEDYNKVGFFFQIKLARSDFVMSRIFFDEMRKNADASTSCYDLDYTGNKGKELGEAFSYGGPGGDSCGN